MSGWLGIIFATPIAAQPRVQITFQPDRPATIYWGGNFASQRELYEHPDQWTFVRQHMDGYLFKGASSSTGAYIGRSQDEVDEPRLAWWLAGKPTMQELGNFDPVDGSDSPTYRSAKIESKLDYYKSVVAHGFAVTELDHDYYMNWDAVSRAFPAYTKEDVFAHYTEKVTGYQGQITDPQVGHLGRTFYDTIKSRYPLLTIHHVFPPIYLDWHGPNEAYYPPISNNFRKVWWPVWNNQPTIKTDGNEIQTRILEMGNRAGNWRGFTADCPYFTIKDSPNEQGKVLTMARWFQAQGRRFFLIVNQNPGDEIVGSEWDRLFYNYSTEYIRAFQRWGGRADRYILESWYFAPYHCVPEDSATSRTMMSLVKDSIQYVRGLGQNLDLTIRAVDDLAEIGAGIYQSQPSGTQDRVAPIERGQTARAMVKLINRGSVNITPVLKAGVGGHADGWTVKILDGASDLTAQALSVHGWPMTDGLDAGAMHSFVIEITNDNAVAGTACTAGLIAVWNPQDPAALTRDAVALTAQAPGGPLVTVSDGLKSLAAADRTAPFLDPLMSDVGIVAGHERVFAIARATDAMQAFHTLEIAIQAGDPLPSGLRVELSNLDGIVRAWVRCADSVPAGVYDVDYLLGNAQGATRAGALRVHVLRDASPPVIYQAESAVFAGPAVGTKYPGYTGTGFIDYINNTNDYLEFTVHSASAGIFRLRWRYSMIAGDRPLELRVNGSVVVPSLSFPATGDWSTWALTSPVRVMLAPGSNKIRLTAIGSSGGIIDYLDVTPDLPLAHSVTGQMTMAPGDRREQQVAGLMDLVRFPEAAIVSLISTLPTGLDLTFRNQQGRILAVASASTAIPPGAYPLRYRITAPEGVMFSEMDLTVTVLDHKNATDSQFWPRYR